MAEAYQVPDIPEAPAGIRIGTLLKLASGDWMAIGYAEAREGGYLGFSIRGLVVLRSPAIEGPWRKVAVLPTGDGDVISDTGSGTNLPGEMMQTQSGRLLLTYPVFTGKLLYSDDEGATWNSLPRAVAGTLRIEERQDGSLLWPTHVGRGRGADLFYAISTDDGATWDISGCWAQTLEPETHYDGLPYSTGRVRAECALVVTDGGGWLGIYREEHGTLAPEDYWHGPLAMPHLMLTRSKDGGKSWTPAFGFLGVEPVMAVLPDGTVLVAYRDDGLASAWLSYDDGRTWQTQVDPAEMPWRRDAAEAHIQWPPGGEPTIRVLDPDTAVVICDTGLLPSGKPLPSGHALSKELHGRVQVRFFRRVPPSGR